MSEAALSRLDIEAEAPAKTAVSVIVPAYNEGVALGPNLKALAAYLDGYRERFDFEIVIVDDGSRDETLAIAERFAREREDTVVLRHDRNRGLGAALRTAFAGASGTYLVTVDSDLSYAPEYVVAMLEKAVEHDADIVLASAYMPGGSVTNVPWLRRMLSREANRFLSLATNVRIHTATCMVRAYRASFARGIPAAGDGMEANAELLFAALRQGAKIVEIPAKLAWSAQRAQAGGRLNLRRLAGHIWAVLRCGIAFRPALLLGIPGLVPGLLPLVVAVLLVMRVSPQTLAVGTLVTIVVQYVSLAIFAGQAATAMGKVAKARRRHASGAKGS